MVSVTNAHVKVRYLDAWPAGVTDATVTALCSQAEDFIQNLAPDETLTLSGAGWIQLSVDLVVRWITYAQYSHAGGAGATGIQPPPVWDKSMQERFELLRMGTDSQSDLIDSHDYNAETA